MKIRILPPDEFYRLKGHPALLGFDIPSPDAASIVIAEDGIEIVGFWFAVTTLHLEPVWINPLYRGGLLIKRMWKGLQVLLDALHVNTALSCSDRPEIGGYLSRLGFIKLPYETYLYTKDEKLRCRFP